MAEVSPSRNALPFADDIEASAAQAANGNCEHPEPRDVLATNEGYGDTEYFEQCRECGAYLWQGLVLVTGAHR